MWGEQWYSVGLSLLMSHCPRFLDNDAQFAKSSSQFGENCPQSNVKRKAVSLFLLILFIVVDSLLYYIFLSYVDTELSKLISMVRRESYRNARHLSHRMRVKNNSIPFTFEWEEWERRQRNEIAWDENFGCDGSKNCQLPHHFDGTKYRIVNALSSFAFYWKFHDQMISLTMSLFLNRIYFHTSPRITQDFTLR